MILQPTTATHSDTALAGTEDTLTLATTASSVEGAYTGQTLSLLTGAGSAQARTIERYPITNLITYSEQFDNAAWTKTNVTITADAIVAPDGATTADKLGDNDTSNSFRQISNTAAGAARNVTYTSSVYVRAAERVFLTIRQTATAATTNYNSGAFNLSTLATTAQNVGDASGTVASITDVGGGWYRCSVSGIPSVSNAGTGVSLITFSPLVFSGSAGYIGVTGEGVHIWGAQVEASATLGPYVATTASAVTARIAIVSPRWRTNRCLHSEAMASHSIGAGGVASVPVVTSNVALAPDGTMTADQIDFALNGGTTTTDRSDIAFLGTTGTTAGQPYVGSIWLRTVDGSAKTLRFDFNGAVANMAPYDSSTLTVTGDWQRFVIGISSAIDTFRSMALRLRGALGTSDSASVYAWGAQNENGTELGDYVATTSTAITVPAAGTTYAVEDRVELLPDYSIVREHQRIEDRSRSAAGVLTRYKWGQFRRIELEDTNVTSHTASRINTWWRDGTPVVLTNSAEFSVTSVYIVNDRLPCGEIAQPYSDEYKATLELETF